MKRRKTYMILFYPFLILMLGTIVWQLYNIVREQKAERRVWMVTAENAEASIAGDTLLTMGQFPGLTDIWTVVQAEAKVTVEGYSQNTVIQGVDFSSFPMKVIESCGKKSLGEHPLLVVGEDFLGSLQDKNGIAVSKRQKQILMEKIGTMKAEIEIFHGNLQESQPEDVKESFSDTGEFLGMVQGENIYMEQEQMIDWLTRKGETPRITKVLLKIQGKERGKRAREALEEAGFSVDIKEAGN